MLISLSQIDPREEDECLSFQSLWGDISTWNLYLTKIRKLVFNLCGKKQQMWKNFRETAATKDWHLRSQAIFRNISTSKLYVGYIVN